MQRISRGLVLAALAVLTAAVATSACSDSAAPVVPVKTDKLEAAKLTAAPDADFWT
jgi:hypothetical protein